MGEEDPDPAGGSTPQPMWEWEEDFAPDTKVEPEAVTPLQSDEVCDDRREKYR